MVKAVDVDSSLCSEDAQSYDKLWKLFHRGMILLHRIL